MSGQSDSPGALTPEARRELLARMLREKARGAEEPCPLSYGQQALWFVYRSAPDSSAYNVALQARILSDVDVSALARAFHMLVERHDCLRSTFAIEGGEPVRRTLPPGEVGLETVEARDWSDARLEDGIDERVRRPFDLERGPICRLSLLTRADGRHVLLMVVHHIAFDGLSADILVHDLGDVYAAVTRETDPLPAPATRYADFVRWQREMVAGAEGQRQLAYWERRLAGELPDLGLPTDRARQPTQRHRGAAVPLTFDPQTVRALYALAEREGTTMYPVLLAAFQVFLHRFCGQDDVLVGAPALGRTRREFERVIGYFVNPIVFRADLGGAPTFRAFLRQVRDTVIEGLDHQDYPFPLLVEHLDPRRDSSQNPIFQAMIDWQKVGRLSDGDGDGARHEPVRPTIRIDLGGLALEAQMVPQQAGQVDLALDVREAGDVLFGNLKYDADLLDADTAARMQGHFQVLLAAVAAAPGVRVSELALLEEPERRRILCEWNRTERDYPRDDHLLGAFERQAGATPEAIAVACEGAVLTYRELDDRANQLAHRLLREGVGADVRVGVCMERSLEMMVAIYGILKAGGAYVPLGTDNPVERIAQLLEDAEAALVLVHAPTVDCLPADPGLSIRLDADWASISGEPVEPPGARIEPDQLAYVIYTSGSTGMPKGVMNAHRGICNRLHWMQEAFALGTRDVVLQKTPYTFDVSVWELFWPLMVGARLVMARPGGHLDTAYLAGVIEEQKVTVLHFVPSMLQIFLNQRGVAASCASLRHVICSGEALSIELQRTYFAALEAPLHNLYGPTEAAVDVTWWECRPDAGLSFVPIGRPIANTQIYLLDERLEPVPIGVGGELHIGGVQVARGYLNRPDLTAERFIPDPFSAEPGARLYKTGDLACHLPDGSIRYLGRMDHQVKVRGVRIELEEIEFVLGEHPAVRSAVVVVRGEGRVDARLVGYVLSAESTTEPALEVLDFLRNKLPDTMVPTDLVWLDEFPLTSSGKVDRKALPAPARKQEHATAEATDQAAPRGELEVAMARIWMDTLEVDEVRAYDTFFDLGGHSLLSVMVVDRFERETGHRINVVDLVGQTLRQTVARLGDGAPPPAPRGLGQKLFGKMKSIISRQE